MPEWVTRVHTWYQRHASLILLLLLFVSFRLLAILLLRPGGYISDTSDFDFYYEWGLAIPKGYRTYDNLWTVYPPLFPAIMLPVFELSSRISPWVDPRLLFHTLFASVMLLFDTGNLLLIHRLNSRLHPHIDHSSHPLTPTPRHSLCPSLCPRLYHARLV